jgi:hypothetical protein
VVAGHTRLVLITVSIFLLVTLWYTRNLYGRFAMLLAIVLTALVAWSDDHNIQLLFCAGLTWFLLLGGLRAVHELRRGLRRTPMSDAHQLAALTGLPPLGWVAFFMALAVGALTLGAWLLLGSPSLN